MRGARARTEPTPIAVSSFRSIVSSAPARRSASPPRPNTSASSLATTGAAMASPEPSPAETRTRGRVITIPRDGPRLLLHVGFELVDVDGVRENVDGLFRKFHRLGRRIREA